MNDKCILSYKKIFFCNSDDDIHLEEHESEVSNFEQVIKILECLGIEKFLLYIKLEIVLYIKIFLKSH